jgi:outer membrane protein
LVIINHLKAIYLNYFLLQTQYELQSQQLKLLSLSQQLYGYNQQKWQSGLIMTQELNTYKGFVLEDSLGLLNIQNQLTKLEGELAKVCNASNLKVKKQALPILPNLPVSDSLTNGLATNPRLKALYMNEQLKKNDLAISKSSLYPQLLGSAGYNYQRSNIDLENRAPVVGTTKEFYVGFSLNYNLFNGFKTKTNIDLAKINLETQTLKTKQLEQQLQVDLGVYVASYQKSIEQYQLANQLLATTSSTLEYWQAKQKAGLITQFDLRNYQKNFLVNQNNALNVWLRGYQAWIEIQGLTNNLMPSY